MLFLARNCVWTSAYTELESRHIHAAMSTFNIELPPNVTCIAVAYIAGVLNPFGLTQILPKYIGDKNMHIVTVHEHETSSLIGSVKLIWSDRQLQCEELRQQHCW